MARPLPKKIQESTPAAVVPSLAPNTQHGIKKLQNSLQEPNQYRTEAFLRLVLWQEIEGSSTCRIKRRV